MEQLQKYFPEGADLGDVLADHVEKHGDAILHTLKHHGVDMEKIVYNDYSTHCEDLVNFYSLEYSTEYMLKIRAAKGDNYYFRKTMDSIKKGIMRNNVGLRDMCFLASSFIADGFTNEYNVEYYDFMMGRIRVNGLISLENISEIRSFDKVVVKDIAMLSVLKDTDESKMIASLLQ